MRSFRVISLSIGLVLLLTQGGFAVTPSLNGAAPPPFKEEVPVPPADSNMIEQLLSLANDPNPYARVEAIERLYLWREDPKVEKALKAAVHDEIWLVRRAAIGFVYGEHQDSMELLADKQVNAASQIVILKQGDEPERVSAALRLAWADQPEAVDALIRALKDNESTIRIAAAEALGADPLIPSRTTERVLAGLKDGATDSDRSVREKSLRGVGRFLFGKYKAETIEFLSKTLQNEAEPSVRGAAARALMEAHTTRSSEILTGFLNDSSAEVRAHAAGGIDLECLPKGLPHLIKALYDPDPMVRRGAVFSIGYAQDRKALQPLLDSLIDSDEAVRLAAAQSLGNLKEPEAVPKMKKIAEDDPSEEVRTMIKKSIQLIENDNTSPITNRISRFISKWKPRPEHCKG